MSNSAHPMAVPVGQTALVNTDNWFTAPDGQQYCAAFGTIHSVSSDQETLGIRTNAKSTNWYLHLGNMRIAGCQLHYVHLVDRDKVNFGEATDHTIAGADGCVNFVRPSRIYDADQ